MKSMSKYGHTVQWTLFISNSQSTLEIRSTNWKRTIQGLGHQFEIRESSSNIEDSREKIRSYVIGAGVISQVHIVNFSENQKNNKKIGEIFNKIGNNRNFHIAPGSLCIYNMRF